MRGMDLRALQSSGGPGGALLRGGLRVLSWGYAGATTLWSAGYRLGLRRVRRLPVPVVSVGNLAVGGTGKTPFVALLVEALRARGRRPGVLSRGYGPRTSSGLSDEGAVLAHRLGADLPQAEAGDRHAAGLALLARHPEVDVLVLDDGFQHRRLARDLDVVLLDALDPLGAGALLPRGLLREPPRALGRAHLIVLTRSERVEAAGLERARQAVAPHTAAPVLTARTVPCALVTDGRPLEPRALDGVPVLALSGLGDPAGFEDTLVRLGARLVARRRLPDHAGLSGPGWAEVEAQARSAGARWIVLTRKDAVKAPEPPAGALPRAVLDVALELDSGRDSLEAALERLPSRAPLRPVRP